MAIVTTQNNYWMSPSALTFTLNSLGNPDYNQVSVLAGAAIIVFVPGVIDYDASRNYRKWTLDVYNSFFETPAAKFVYVRLEKSGNKALICYSDKEVALDVGDYYYIYLGKISASVNSSGIQVDRYWEDAFKTGILNTDQSINESGSTEWAQMFRWNKTTDLIDVLKNFSSFVVNKFFLRDKEVTDIKRSVDDDTNVPISDTSLTTSEYVDKRYLRKDVRDVAEGHIMFKEGLMSDGDVDIDGLLKIGAFIDSITAGRGAGIFPDGRGQFQSLEVRDSLKVLELIYNRLSAQESDFIFTEAGTVDQIEQLDATTYRLTMRKRHDNDFTAFREGDVVRGVINNLSSATKEYNTSFVRVLSVNTVANTIEVSVYPDSEVPSGENHPPTALMVLQRWGNTFDAERQSCWYISSSEGRIVWLTGVTQPILADHNYGSFYGKPVRLSVLEGKAIDYNQPYIYVRGMAVQDLIRIDYQGNVIKDFRDRGVWVADPSEPYRNMDTLQDDVWHLGCKWRCLIDQTTQEPRWNATDWQMIEGNTNLSMQFGSSAGDMFFAGQVNTTVTPYVYLGNIDISSDIRPADWQWMRDSGNVTEDNAWAIAHSTNGRVLQLGNEDMGSNWSVARKVAFICTAYLRDGEELYGIENRVIV